MQVLERPRYVIHEASPFTALRELCYEPLLLNSDFNFNSMPQIYLFHCLCVSWTMPCEVSRLAAARWPWTSGEATF